MESFKGIEMQINQIRTNTFCKILYIDRHTVIFGRLFHVQNLIFNNEFREKT